MRGKNENGKVNGASAVVYVIAIIPIVFGCLFTSFLDE